MNTREICKLCWHANPIGFDVPDNIWNDVTPPNMNILCIGCFIKLADEKLIAWDKEIKLFPVSLYTHLEGNEVLKCQE